MMPRPMTKPFAKEPALSKLESPSTELRVARDRNGDKVCDEESLHHQDSRRDGGVRAAQVARGQTADVGALWP